MLYGPWSPFSSTPRPTCTGPNLVLRIRYLVLGDLKLQGPENKREFMLMKCFYGFIIFDSQATFFYHDTGGVHMGYHSKK